MDINTIRNMSNENFEKYDNRCNIIKNLILQKYKNDEFIFKRNLETYFIEIIINNNNIITLLPDDSWKQIQRHINKKLNYIIEDCSICFNEIKTNVSCNKCGNNWCRDCYINIFRINKGIIKCPHCRFEFGKEIPYYMIEICINEIKNKS